jgi:hypothetical protein
LHSRSLTERSKLTGCEVVAVRIGDKAPSGEAMDEGIASI